MEYAARNLIDQRHKIDENQTVIESPDFKRHTRMII